MLKPFSSPELKTRRRANRVAQIQFVLDSFALITFLDAAKGTADVRHLLERASRADCELFMSIINLGEVLYIAEREQGLTKAREALVRIDNLPIQVVNVDRVQMLDAAHIKARWPMAYADCFAVALAKLKNAPIVTGDPEFRQLEAAAVVPITWLAIK